jgi:hypothetical protein
VLFFRAIFLRLVVLVLHHTAGIFRDPPHMSCPMDHFVAGDTITQVAAGALNVKDLPRS